MFNVNHYFKATKYPNDSRVEQMGTFLVGEAKTWYMNMVAPDPDKWTIEEIGTALFDNFFPARIRSKFRRDFETAEQGERNFKPFCQHVKNLANRLPDITQRQIILRIWNGSNQYLRNKWNESGYDPELSTLEELEITGERFEIAENNRKYDNASRNRLSFYRNTNYNSYRGNITSLGARAVNPPKMQPNQINNSQNRMRTPLPDKEQKRQAFQNRKQLPQRQQQPKRDFSSKSFARVTTSSPGGKLANVQSNKTKDKLNELRAAGKCFICEETGHLSRDCIKKPTVKPPKISNNNVQIRFEELEQDVENAIEINMADIDFHDDNDNNSNKEELEGWRETALREFIESSTFWYGDNFEHVSMKDLMKIINEDDEMSVIEKIKLIKWHRRDRALRYWRELPGYHDFAADLTDSEDGKNIVLQTNDWIFETDDEENDQPISNDDEKDENSVQENQSVREVDSDDESVYYSAQENHLLRPLEQNEATLTERDTLMHIRNPEDKNREVHQCMIELLENDQHKEWCIECYKKLVPILKQIIPPELTVITDTYDDLRFTVQSLDNGQMIMMNDIIGEQYYEDLHPLTIDRRELESPTFDMQDIINRTEG